MRKGLLKRIFDTDCERSLATDALIVALAVIIGVALHVTGGWHWLFSTLPGSGVVKTFFAGLFFTSGFTTPLAIAALVGLAETTAAWQMALVGGAGAVVGDLILFLFVRDRVGTDIMCVLGTPKGRRFAAIFDRRIFKYAVPFLGALVIASPLPDELGISMMGLSRMPVYVMIPLSFVMNAFGIFFIATLAQL